MLARLAVLALALTTLAGCYVAPAGPPRSYGYGYSPGYYAAPVYRPYYGGGWGGGRGWGGGGGWGHGYGYGRRW